MSQKQLLLHFALLFFGGSTFASENTISLQHYLNVGKIPSITIKPLQYDPEKAHIRSWYALDADCFHAPDDITYIENWEPPFNKIELCPPFVPEKNYYQLSLLHAFRTLSRELQKEEPNILVLLTLFRALCILEKASVILPKNFQSQGENFYTLLLYKSKRYFLKINDPKFSVALTAYRFLYKKKFSPVLSLLQQVVNIQVKPALCPTQEELNAYLPLLRYFYQKNIAKPSPADLKNAITYFLKKKATFLLPTKDILQMLALQIKALEAYHTLLSLIRKQKINWIFKKECPELFPKDIQKIISNYLCIALSQAIDAEDFLNGPDDKKYPPILIDPQRGLKKSLLALPKSKLL